MRFRIALTWLRQPLRPLIAFQKSYFHSNSIQALIKRELLARSPQVKIPDEHYFAQLKAEEKRQLGKTPRVRKDYAENQTAALALPCTHQELQKSARCEEQLLELSEEHIVEHASRRVDLMFYTLTAYYQTQCIPTMAMTTLQYGMGRTGQKGGSISHACHSSILPALLDKTIYDNSRTGKKHKSLICDTHLMRTINSTVELPKAVNALDSVLENECEGRKISLDILRYVSLGAISPIRGISLFLNMMDHILNQIRSDLEQSQNKTTPRYSFFAQRHLNLNMVKLVTAGTVEHHYSPKTQTVAKPYVHSLLRLPMTQDFNSAKEEEGMYHERIIEIQAEILTSRI